MIDIRDLPSDGVVREPGLYRMTAGQYHADPCPEPSLSSSCIRTLLERTPLHAWTAHPKLGAQPVEGEPADDEESTPAMVLGTVVHSLLLGAGKRWCVLDHDSFRTKAAKLDRDCALSRGDVPILRHRFERASAIAKGGRHAIAQLDGGAHALANNLPEVVAIWKEEIDLGAGEVITVWCRSMMDLCPTAPDRGWWTVGDLKTTAEILRPDALARKMIGDGYDIQAAWYRRGFEALHPFAQGRTAFRFYFVETAPPFLAVAAGCSGMMESSGEQKVMAGLGIWARCLADAHFPGYPTEVLRLEPPTYLENQWREREQADELVRAALNPIAWRRAA